MLIVISPPESVPTEHAHLHGMFKRGLQTFHLRKPRWNKAEYSEYLDKVDPMFRARIVVHNHHELVPDFGLKGRHYTSYNCPPLPIRATPGCSSSLSLHKLSQLKDPLGALDYAFLSPIFDSISKKGYDAGFSHGSLKTAIAASDIPIIALGGITANNLAVAASLGFSGAAVLGTVWQHEDPLWDFENLLRASASLSQGHERIDI